MVEESPRASLGSCVFLGGVGRGFIVSFPKPAVGRSSGAEL